LEDLRFSSTRAGEAGSVIIASSLDTYLYLGEGHNDKLVKLDLCDNSFGNTSSHLALARVLGRAKSLSYLNLGYCNLGDNGVGIICSGLLQSETELEHLDLSGNELNLGGANHIAEYIARCGGKLKILHLEDNNDMTSEGVQHIANSAKFHRSIEEIQLNSCRLGDTEAQALIDAYGLGGEYLPQLKMIFLNCNFFSAGMLDQLEQTFGGRLGEMDDNNPDGEADDDETDED
jgi:hypothetical protein